MGTAPALRGATLTQAAEQEQHWSEIRESTTVLGIKIMIFAYRLGGKPLFRILLAPVITFYYLADRRARYSANDYFRILHQFDSKSPQASLKNGFRLFWEFGVTLIDKFSVWMGRIDREHVTIHGDEFIEQQLQRQQGAILLLSHVGNFEVCHALSRSHAGVKLTVLVHTQNAQKFNELLHQFVEHSNIELLQVSELGISNAIVLSERVASGEFLAIAGDRVPLNSDATIDVEFLGKMAAFPAGPFILASALAAPVIMLNCLRHKDGYHIHFDKLTDGVRVHRKQRQAHLQNLVQNYASQLQAYVLDAPFQWFNFFDFWRIGAEHEKSLEKRRSLGVQP